MFSSPNRFTHLNPRTKGALWMLCWAVFYSVLNICIKKLGDFPKPLIIWIRTFVQLCFLVPVAFQQKMPLPLLHQLPWYILCICITYPAIQCTYLAYANLPLSTATSIGFIEPSMGIVLAFIFFRLPMRLSQWLFVLLGYLGVLFINYPMVPGGGQTKWILVALLANLLASLGRVITKHQTNQIEPRQVIFYGKLFFLPLATFLAIPYFGTPITTHQIPFLLGISFLSLISQYCYVQALNITHFDLVGPMTYVRILFAVPFGYFFFGEIPTMYAFIGVLFIVVSNYKAIDK